MRFIQIEMYGFGKWVDQTIRFSNNHPLCIYGRNESGKSTIQQFILYVLFGLPPRKLKLFKPVQSNKIGGRLTIEDSIVGRYQIERIEQKVFCYLSTGEVKDEAWLQKHLQGINREVYTSIYAFSAIELAEMKQMKKTDISDVLLSVGLTGSTKIYEAEKDIETKLGNLFKKQGRIPFINQQIHAVKEGHKTLVDRQQKEAIYNEKQEELEQLRMDIEEVDEARKITNAQMFKVEKVLHALPQIKEFQVIQTELVNHHSKKQPFPEKGVERLERVQERLLPLEGELRMEEMQFQKDIQAVKTLETSLIDPQTIHTVQSVLQQKATYDYLQQEEKSFTTKIMQIEHEVKNDLAIIRLDEEVITHVDLPFYLEKRWRQLQQTRDKLMQEEESQTIRNEEIKRKETELEQSSIGEHAIEERRHTLDVIPSKPNKRKQHGKWRYWEERRLKVAKNIVIIASILAALSFAFALYNDNAILFTVPIVLLIAGIFQYINTKNTIHLLLQQSNLHDSDHTGQPESNQLEKEYQQLNLEKKHWQEDQKDFLKKENAWIQQMEAEQQAYPFIQHIELEYWLDLLGEIRIIQRKMAEIKQLQAEMYRVRENIGQIEQEVKQVSKELSMDELTFEKLQDILEKQQTNEHFIRQYRKSMKQSTSTIEALKKKISVFEEEIDKLFSYAEVKDEEAYLQIAKEITDEQKMRNDKSRLGKSLETLLGKEELATLLEQPLTESELLARQEELQMKEKEMEQQSSSLNKQVASIELEISHLELSDEHSSAIYQHQMERDALQKMANKWASLKVAQTALKNAKENYQVHHLEEVMQQTSQYFRTITGGAYTKVIAPESNGLFEVEGNQQIRYTVDKLSQGTIEQLYVSLRLAISVVMNKTNRIPFMIDDAFVHFDSTRMQYIIQLLTSIRQDQQIIIFTCRDDIANLFKQVHMLD